MNTQQIKVRLTENLITFLQFQAEGLDLTLSQFIKYILIKEAQSYKMSPDISKKIIGDELNSLIINLEKER